MKHWDPSNSLANAERLSPGDRKRMAAMLDTPPRTRGRTRPDLASMVGLTLALAFLAGLAWAVTPTDPVSAEVR
jgi:hypothetical protein